MGVHFNSLYVSFASLCHRVFSGCLAGKFARPCCWNYSFHKREDGNKDEKAQLSHSEPFLVLLPFPP